jgi:hypothetical protein
MPTKAVSRASWSRPLSQALDFASVIRLTTLDDVRSLVERHLPAAHRELPHWRGVSKAFTDAATGGDPVDVEIALMLAGAVEGLSCRPTNRRKLRESVRRPRGTSSQAVRNRAALLEIRNHDRLASYRQVP